MRFVEVIDSGSAQRLGGPDAVLHHQRQLLTIEGEGVDLRACEVRAVFTLQVIEEREHRRPQLVRVLDPRHGCDPSRSRCSQPAGGGLGEVGIARKPVCT